MPRVVLVLAAFFSCLSLPAWVVPANAAAPELEDIAARLQTLASDDLADSETRDALLSAREFIRRNQIEQAEADEYEALLAEAGSRENTIRARTDALSLETLVPAVTASLDASELAAELRSLRGGLTDLRASRDALERQMASREAEAARARERINEIGLRLAEISPTEVTATETEGSLREARLWLRQAETEALLAERRALEAYLASQPARFAVRSAERAAKMIADLSPVCSSAFEQFDWSQRSFALEGNRLIINTTSAGMRGQPELDISLDDADDQAIVADIVYNPLQTPLLGDARNRGLTCVDGLGMLLHQAVEGFEHWGGITPEVDGELRDFIVEQMGIGTS